MGKTYLVYMIKNLSNDTGNLENLPNVVESNQSK